MTFRIVYAKILFPGCKHSILKRYLPAFILLLFFSGQPDLYSQELPEYDEIAVSLEIPGLGASEIDALIKSDILYLPVTDLFNFLKIKNEPSPGLETISGFFVNPEATYTIDRTKNQILSQNKIIDLGPGDLIRTETNLFLNSLYFGTVFGLECKFNFRALSVRVTSKLELPLIREMKQEIMRRNISHLKGEIIADTTISRIYPLFKFGMADWSAYTSQEINGKSDARINLSLGSIIAGGEATASLYFNSSDPFNEKQQQYLWRYVNNDFSPLRQVLAGKIRTNSISSIYNPVIGVQLTNTPTTYKRSFGTYNLSEKTEPGWIVELYINNVLVDYVKADASGFFNFEIPLVYGNSNVKLKYFGPWGEERTREQNISIPYNFLSEKTLEYTLSAGIVEDTSASRFTKASINYGASKSLTIGGGAEYLSSIISQPFMPYVNASMRVTNNMLLFGEYALGVRTRGTLSYRFPSNLQLELDYTLYDKEQKAISYNYREERKAILTVPLKIGKLSSFQRFSLNQIILPTSRYTNGEWVMSGSVFGVNTNITTYAMFIENIKPYFYSNLAAAFRLPGRFIFMPQIQYSYSENKLLSAKTRIEKQVLKNGYINLSYEQNFRNNFKLAEVGIRYDFSFAQAGASVRRYDETTSLIQYARGSLINDRKTKYLGTDNRSNVGRGGITIVPFIDLDSDGQKDPGEPKAFGLNLRSDGGHIEKDDRDTTIRITGLEPYTNCYIEFDPNSFENITWRLEKQKYSIAVDPNILKTIEIPVTIAGEASGYIYFESDGEKRGLGRIIVNISDNFNNSTVKILSEDDGYYSLFGLRPGNYFASTDTSQLRKLNMTSEPEFLSFSIEGGIEGDIADGLDFVLKMKPSVKTDTMPAVSELPEVKKDTTFMILHELTEEVYTISEDSWAIQIGAFRNKTYAEGFESMLERELGKDVQITIAGDYYRVRILDLHTRAEVDENVIKLNKLGFNELWIIRLLAMQQQRILVTKEDSIARIRETVSERESPLTPEERAEMQLDAFRLGSDAFTLRKYLAAPLGEQPTTRITDKYYSLETPQQPILDPVILEAIKDLNPEYGSLSMDDEWRVRVVAPSTEEPIEPAMRESVIVNKIPVLSGRSVTVSGLKLSGFVQAGKPAFTAPSIALQVAIYHRESQALKARKKIVSKLSLPVEIVKQYDYYHVIVTGFYTREETYPYYPELAGIGFPGITLIENYQRNK
jgi:hypothetical protein